MNNSCHICKGCYLLVGLSISSKSGDFAQRGNIWLYYFTSIQIAYQMYSVFNFDLYQKI